MILNADQRRGMDFIAAATRGGYRPTTEELDEWRLRPDPIPGRRGRLIEPAKPSPFAQQLTGGAATALTALGKSIEAIQSNLLRDRLQSYQGVAAGGLLQQAALVGRMFEIPARYEPDEPPEPFVDHLIRLGWLDRDGRGGLGLTPLGRALMRSDDAEGIAEDDDAATVLVLGSEDALAYANLLGRIAEAGEALIVDPYLRVTELLQLATHTQANRLLVGPGLSAGDVAAMAVLLESGTVTPKIELRQAAAGVLHDRFIVGDNGVHMIGASINGVGKVRATLLVPVPMPAADTMRTQIEGWWHDAQVLAVAPEPSAPVVASRAGPAMRVTTKAAAARKATARKAPAKKAPAKKAPAKKAPAKKAPAKKAPAKKAPAKKASS